MVPPSSKVESAATCAYCGTSLEKRKCSQCGRKARDAEPIRKALLEALGIRYQFVSILGSGGFAEVYKAKDTMLNRDVAVKRVKLDTFADATYAKELRRRAVREAQVAARLNHPNIVTIFDIIDRPSGNFIVMEYIDGDTLEGHLRKKKRLSLDETTDILSQAAEAIDYAHSQTVIHRDIKPANIMLESSGRVMVTDFGIAKSETCQDITASGSILGTPNYMSPEQARGNRKIDGRSDLYALGCIAFECLAGHKANRGSGGVEVLMQIVNSDPPVLDTIALGLHDDIHKIMRRALAKEPEHRFGTGMELIRSLRDMPPAIPRESKGQYTDGVASAEPVVMPAVTRRDPDTASSFDMHLNGRLSEKSVPELIRLIYSARKTGILHIAQDNLSKRIYFRKGTIVFANSDVEDDRLGKRLVREKLIDQSLLDLACDVMQDTGLRLGQTIVELGNFDENRLNELVQEQIQNIIYSLFQWKDGYFGFELLSEPVEEDIALNLSTAETILEGVRRIDSLEFIRDFLGDTRLVLVQTEKPLLLFQKMSLTPSEGYVFSRVDGKATAEELAAISPLGETETLRCVFALLATGVLELSEKVPSTSRMSRPSADEFQHPKPEPRAKDSEPKQEAVESEPDEEPDEQAVLDDIATKHASLDCVSHYELLDIETTASAAAIKRAYYEMAKKYHPDRHHMLQLNKAHGLLEELFVKIGCAYKCLSDPAERKQYDCNMRKSGRSSVPAADSPVAEKKHAAAPQRGSANRPEEKPGSRVSYTLPEPKVLAEAQFRAAKVHFAEMSYYDAIQCARDAIRYVPDKAPYHNLLARALAKNPKWYKQAEQHFQFAIELDEFDLESRLGLAALYEDNGMQARADKFYRAILEYDPDNTIASEKINGQQNSTTFGKFRLLTRLLARDKNKK